MPQSRKLPASRIAELPLPERLDVKIIEKIRPMLQRPTVTKLGKLGNVGDEPPLLSLSAALLLAGTLARKPHLRRAGIRMALAHVIAISFKEWGKNNVDRTRPDEQLEGGRYYMAIGNSRDADLRSFPSDHTAGAVAIARAFSRDYPRYKWPALAAAAVIGALQVPRRAHYPGDVLAGALAGMVAENMATFAIEGLGLANRRLSR